MKKTITAIRILAGALFVFSGLVKAIDPLGLAYKMQEFFDVWSSGGHLVALMEWLNAKALLFSRIMIVLEVLSGVALLIGWRKKITLWFLLLLSVFFTFLTAYALFSGSVRECGCFGACIPLSPVATFLKDVVLTLLIALLLMRNEYVRPLAGNLVLSAMLIATMSITVVIQERALTHLPVVDCLPYKKGNNILELRQWPADATFDQYEYVFIYSKNGETKTFSMNALPDSTWKYVDRKQQLLSKGNGKTPQINDFSLTGPDGNDATEAILSQPGQYYLFFVKTMQEAGSRWLPDFGKLYQVAKEKKRNVYIITGDAIGANVFFHEQHHYDVPIYSCDVTAIKTAARSVPTLFLMNGPVVENKWGVADLADAGKHN